MKPNFALSLSFDGIRLMHRSTTGWTIVGDVALDSADLAGELAMLRKTALSLDPAGLRTKLLLPNDQIKYLSLDTTRATEDDVRAALDGATPYPVADLAYDHVRAFGRTYIAAVARETLDEAEAFATEHRFAPVSFAGVPEEFTYQGEAFFGQTKASLSLLPPGEKVERDAEPVKVASKPARKAVPAAPAGDLPGPAPAETAMTLSDLAKSDILPSDLEKSVGLPSDLDKSDRHEPDAPNVPDLAPVMAAPPKLKLSKKDEPEPEITAPDVVGPDRVHDTSDLTGALPADVAPTEDATDAAMDLEAAPPLEDVQDQVPEPVAEAPVAAALPAAEPPLTPATVAFSWVALNNSPYVISAGLFQLMVCTAFATLI